MSEETWRLEPTGLSTPLAGNEKAMLEKAVAGKLRQVSAQAVMQAKSSAIFCVSLAGAA